MPKPSQTIATVLAAGRRTKDGCLQWPGKRMKRGYARITVRNEKHLIHRWVWTQLRGSIPDGLTVDHICHNEAAARGECSGGYDCPHRVCIEITHLRLADAIENWRNGTLGIPAIRRARTHCPQGHPYDAENTSIRPDGRRRCRACAREESRRKRDPNRTKTYRARPRGDAYRKTRLR